MTGNIVDAPLLWVSVLKPSQHRQISCGRDMQMHRSNKGEGYKGDEEDLRKPFFQQIVREDPCVKMQRRASTLFAYASWRMAELATEERLVI